MMKPNGTLAKQSRKCKVFKRPFRKNVFNRNESLATMTLSSTKLTRFHATQDLEDPVTPSEIQHAIKKMKTESSR
jgi:hypothetical protein